MEGFQSGLSWRTILVKRDNFRNAFAGFNFHTIAEYDDSDIELLLTDTGIVRHRGKIEAVVNNARRAVEMQHTEGSLATFFWRYEPPVDERGPPQTVSTSPASTAMSKELKKHGWRFVGPTTAFAFMQAMGLINDHAHDCATRPQAAASRDSFRTPRAGGSPL